MAWFRVDDSLHAHPKWVALSPSARALWVTAGSWSMGYLTDGAIPANHLRVWGATRKQANELVACGLWEETGDGYQFHDWHKYQPTAESVKKERERQRLKKARQRAKAAANVADGTQRRSATTGRFEVIENHA